MYQVIATGSTGNAVLYHQAILVDIGVPFSALQPHLQKLRIVLLTHEHSDHINLATLRRLSAERPTLRIGCCEWMEQYTTGLRNVDIYQPGRVYNYGAFQISPVKLYHDVPNCGYRIIAGQTKILHATDTAHLQGIEAPGYDLYALEHNYDNEVVFEQIHEIESRGQFAYQKGAINSHLSEQQARDFIFKNRAPHSRVLRLHETRSYL